MKKLALKALLPVGLIKGVVLGLLKANVDKLDVADKALDVVLLRLPFPANLFADAIQDVVFDLIKREIEKHG